MKNKSLIIITASLIILILSASFLYKKLSPQVESGGMAIAEVETTKAPEDSGTDSAPEVMAPDFTVYDINGEPVTLSDFQGTPVVINFWTSWCSPCQAEMPHFQQLYSELEGKVQFMMINVSDGYNDTVESGKEFIDENAYTFPVFFDTERDASAKYSVISFPQSYFINAEGCCVAKALTSIDLATLELGISKIYTDE